MACSWEKNILPLIRLYIDDDSDTSQTNSDDRLMEIAAIAAYEVSSQLSFSSTYTITLNPASISPSPSDDSNFCLLVAAKSACLLARAEYKTHALQNIRITDGPSTINLEGVAKAMKDRYEDLCSKYEHMARQYMLGNSISGAAVTGPLVNSQIPPRQGNL